MLYAEPVHENMWKQEEEVIVCSDEPLSPFAKAESLAEGGASCQSTSSRLFRFYPSTMLGLQACVMSDFDTGVGHSSPSFCAHAASTLFN